VIDGRHDPRADRPAIDEGLVINAARYGYTIEANVPTPTKIPER
jgi:hypothetical protein